MRLKGLRHEEKGARPGGEAARVESMNEPYPQTTLHEPTFAIIRSLSAEIIGGCPAESFSRRKLISRGDWFKHRWF
jgi:hypothetical protein